MPNTRLTPPPFTHTYPPVRVLRIQVYMVEDFNQLKGTTVFDRIVPVCEPKTKRTSNRSWRINARRHRFQQSASKFLSAVKAPGSTNVPLAPKNSAITTVLKGIYELTLCQNALNVRFAKRSSL